MEQTVLNSRYALEQKIGEGGMATVYRGRDTRLNRPVAVKVLHSHYANDPDFLQRFQHEAQAAAILNHPNVINVYDVGQDGATHYIVMEFVDGENLKTMINREAPLRIADAVAIAEEVAKGLEAAHRVGLIHRDIKPQNIIVTPDKRVHIADFGIAKSQMSTAHTQTGTTFGTTDYISPEQAQGLAVSPQSDIYSLGVTLYEMLSGRLPFTGDTPVTVAMHHVTTPPPPIRQFNTQVPPNLEAMVLQAMSKEPQQRPASARAFAQTLAAYQNRADQDTVVQQAPRQPPPQQPSPHPHGAPPVAPAPPRAPAGQVGNKSSSSTAPRSTIPAPRSSVGKAPRQGGAGCGIFVVGMLIMAGVLGLVLLFISGAFDSMLTGIDRPPTSTPNPFEQTATATATDADVTTTPTLTPEPTRTSVPLVMVPNIVGMSETEARNELIQRNLRPVNSGTTRHHDTIPEGAVVDQLVPPNTEKPEGHPVTYSLSLGREIVLIDVPDLTSRRLDSAQAEAERLGLNVSVTEEPSTISEGFIIRQNPAPGLRVEAGDTVHLFVSIGDKVWMPNLMGISEEEAKLRLESTEGIFLSYVDYQGYDKIGQKYYEVVPGTVVSTVPDKDQWVPRGTGVTLGVREYDNPQPSPLQP